MTKMSTGTALDQIFAKSRWRYNNNKTSGYDSNNNLDSDVNNNFNP